MRSCGCPFPISFSLVLPLLVTLASSLACSWLPITSPPDVSVAGKEGVTEYQNYQERKGERNGFPLQCGVRSEGEGSPPLPERAAGRAEERREGQREGEEHGEEKMKRRKYAHDTGTGAVADKHTHTHTLDLLTSLNLETRYDKY